MNKIAVVTDSNSGITQEQARGMGIYVLPMPFYINEKLYEEGITLSQEEFYEKLQEDADISTSQPSPASVTELWDHLLTKYEQIIHIPMSSGLSAACATAMALAREDYEGTVFVVDNQRISVTQRQSVLDALYLIRQGKSAREVYDILMETKMDASIYIMLETLKYLKKGGRITPTAAALGTILNLKPVLQIQGEKLDAFGKARGKNKAKAIMLDAIRKDLTGRFAKQMEDGQMTLSAAYTGNEEEAQEWLWEIQTAFPDMECHMDPLSLSVACHIGHGALAITCQRKIGGEGKRENERS